MTHKEINGIASAAIHGLHNVHAEHAHLPPIYATSTFTFDSAEQGMQRFSGKEKGYTYSRFANPTTQAAADIVALLETFDIWDEAGSQLTAKAFLTASGQAAMSTLFLSLLSAGDTVLCSRSVYGGTYEFLADFVQKLGIRCILVDMSDVSLLQEMLSKDKTIKILHLETPANPTMQCIDIQSVCDIATRYGKLVSIDNTFATPYLQQPFRYGVDFIFHSTTKFLNGHGSAIGGVLIGKDISLMNTVVYKTYKLLGVNANPFDAFMLIQGIKTLALRMEQHSSNAEKVADFLTGHPCISVVNYNGLSTHPDYEISKKQMKRPGAVLSFELKDGFDKAKQFINQLQLCTRAVSVGTTDTLISHPASMSHAGMSREARLKAGVTDGLIRISVGLEAIDDILNDLQQALG